jgi:outer membrane protein TolC
LLNAENAVLAQRRQAVDLRARALSAQVGLVRALGGGYMPDASPAFGDKLAAAH